MSVTNLKTLGTCGICHGSILVDARMTQEEQYAEVYVCDPSCKKLLWEKKCAEEKESYQQSCSNPRCGQVLSVQSESTNLQIIKFIGKLLLIATIVLLIYLYILPIFVGLFAKFILFFFYADSSLDMYDIFSYRFKMHSSQQNWGITEDTGENMRNFVSIFKALEKPHFVYDSTGLMPFSMNHIKLGRYYNFWIVIISIIVWILVFLAYATFVTINYCCPFITRPCRRKTRRIAVKRFKTK